MATDRDPGQASNGESTYEAAMKRMAPDIAALCDGANTLTRDGNRVAALALLWAAVGIAPTHLGAHRRLASALANSGDIDAAAEEYARFIEFVLKLGDVPRAALELSYALASIGDHAALRTVSMLPVSLGDVIPALATRPALPEPAAQPRPATRPATPPPAPATIALPIPAMPQLRPLTAPLGGIAAFAASSPLNVATLAVAAALGAVVVHNLAFILVH